MKSAHRYRTRNTKRRRRERIALCEAQNWRCAFCGVVMEIHTSTTEHIEPLAVSRDNSWDNKAAACEPCNNQRSVSTSRYINSLRKLSLSQEAQAALSRMPRDFKADEPAEDLPAHFEEANKTMRGLGK